MQKEIIFPMKIGIIQHQCVKEVEKNLSHIETGIREAAQQGAQLVVLQELHNSLYFCQTENTNNFDLAESIPGPSTEKFGELAKELNIVIVTSLFERRAPGLYHNTAVVTSVGCLGVQVCWDQWYPEGARLMALQGAQLLIYPTAIGYESSDTKEEQERQREAWMTVQRGHAVANGIPVIAVNRTGHEPDPSGQTKGIQFWGSSFVAGPQGEILFQAPKDDEMVAVIDVDLQRSENVRRWWPFLRDRRIEEYDGLTQRFID